MKKLITDKVKIVMFENRINLLRNFFFVINNYFIIDSER